MTIIWSKPCSVGGHVWEWVDLFWEANHTWTAQTNKKYTKFKEILDNEKFPFFFTALGNYVFWINIWKWNSFFTFTQSYIRSHTTWSLHKFLLLCFDHSFGVMVCNGWQFVVYFYSWWRHQMETFSALLSICAENSPVPGEFPSQRPVTRSFDVFFLSNGFIKSRSATISRRNLYHLRSVNWIPL